MGLSSGVSVCKASECSLVMDVSTTTCSVIDATTTVCVGPDVVTYQDWIFVNSWLVFLVALAVVGVFFSGFGRGRKVS